MKPINVTCLKKSFIFTFILGFLAYGYVFVNYTPSHDGMMIVKTNQWWEMSVGRFVVMYYAPIRGYLESPWLIGLLTMTYTALAVYLTINMLGIKDDNRRVFVVSAVYVLNIAYISNSCVYIFCWDLLALALLASVYAAYLIIRYDRLLFPGLWNLDKMHPEFAEYVRGSGMREGDVLIIAGSDDRTLARYSAVSVALELL